MYSKAQTGKENPSNRIQILKPLSLTATSGDTEGEIDLTWEPVAGAHTYVIQKSCSKKKLEKWIFVDVITRSSYTVTKLKSNHRYWFRVAAVTSKGQSLWSKPIQKKAP